MFNEVTYAKCIKHLVAIKTMIVIVFTIVFLIVGIVIGFASEKTILVILGAILGGILGCVIGISATWKIEMRIQESYWRIDMLRAVKNKNINNI